MWVFDFRPIKMRVRKPILIVLIAALSIVALTMLLADVVPPRAKTHGAMHMCKRRVLRYAAEHGKLPSSLQETQPIEGFNSSIKDAWGVVLDYSVDANGAVRFVSLGKDRKLGGTGKNMDMIGIFPSKRPDGSWSEEFVEWSQDPFAPFKNKNR